ncbi:MAG: ABC transporter ATP-binding protein [Gammaproteobacteria bacterium]|nr:ABC transporter ATP-binding protein [Gammaproteobacteria bacterium]
MNGPVIDVEDVAFRYPTGTMPVSGLSFMVGRGEVFGLLGANGAGKTTTIKLLTTLLRPTRGRIRIAGLDTGREATVIKGRLGVVPQDNNLDPALDVRGNLVFHGLFHGLGKRETVRRAEQWLEPLGLKEKAREPVMRLSGGTKRKVMLAKAFMTEPELLILDEPTSGLDQETRSFIWQQITRHCRSHGTVLLSTHYPEEAEHLCDRVGVLRGGRLGETDQPAGMGTPVAGKIVALAPGLLRTSTPSGAA